MGEHVLTTGSTKDSDFAVGHVCVKFGIKWMYRSKENLGADR